MGRMLLFLYLLHCESLKKATVKNIDYSCEIYKVQVVFQMHTAAEEKQISFFPSTVT